MLQLLRQSDKKHQDDVSIGEDTESEKERAVKEEEERESIHEEGKYHGMGEDERKKQLSALFSDPSKGTFRLCVCH